MSFTDNFATSASSSNWTVTLQGTANGTYSFNTGNCTLTPKPSAINSVAMLHSGTFTDITATVALSANPGALQYFVLSLGSGAPSPEGSGSWWYTGFANGYSLQIMASGAMGLYKSVSGTFTLLQSYATGTVTPSAANVLEIKLSPTGVTALLNGTALASEYADTTYTSGSILIAQGEYSNGAGGIATITNATGTGGSTSTSVTGSATTPAATASGTATASTQASGSPTAPAATATGAATSTTVASASATAPAATASGAANSGTTTAVGNATAPQATASGVSSSTTTATAAVTAPSATATGVATSTSSTTVSGNAKAPAATASGIAAGYFTGHACGTSNQCAYCHIWRHIGPCWRYVVA